MTTTPPPERRPVIEARDLHKAFARTQALRGLSLAIDAGEVVAVTGRSGSGKSTLLNCLSGVLVPDTGEVHVNGTRLDLLDDDARTRLRREHFGIVFQSCRLVPELTAVENVALPLMFGGQDRATATATALEWLERLRLDGSGQARPGELSGGQAQRVAIARALAPRPRIIFADEPTGSLDSIAGEEVLGLLVGAAREAEGTSVVIVTHDNRVAAYADREIVLHDGRTGVRPDAARSEAVR